MAINLHSEHLLTLTEAAKELPPLRNGKRIHVSTLYRWAQRGVRGVRLETTRLGRTILTSREALQRFTERLSAPSTSSRAPRSSGQVDRCERELDRHGI